MIRKHLPNFITCMNAFSGSIAVVMAFQSNYKLAAAFIALAAVFDFFDGFAARLLKSFSPIGKELDSLADIISFGMAPAAIVFSFFQDISSEGLCSENSYQILAYSAFLITVFSALRLAKFNIDERQTSSFIGLPTPANAIFWAFGIAGSFEWLTGMNYFEPLFLFAGVLISSFLLISPFPMFALKFKHYRWKGNRIRYIFLAGCLVAIIAFSWTGLSIAVLWYIILCLCTVRQNRPV